MMRFNYIWLMIVVFLLLGATEVERKTKVHKIAHATSKNIEAKVGEEIEFSYCEFGNIEPKIFLLGVSTYIPLGTRVSQGCLIVYIPASITHTSGSYDVVAYDPKATQVIASLYLSPLQAQGPLEIYIGPKSINKTDAEGSMVTILPKDKFGNMVTASSATFHTIGGRVQEKNQEAELRYGSRRIFPFKESKMLASSQVDESFATQLPIRVLTGCPSEMKINISELNPIADGRQFFQVITNDLTDSDKLPITDGTNVTFKMSKEGHGAIASYNSVVVNGRATSWIKNPTESGIYSLKSIICDKESRAKNITFRSAILSHSFAWTENQLTIGPLTTGQNSLLSDGTEARLTITMGEIVEVRTKQVKNGKVSLSIHELWSEDKIEIVQVDILGTSFTIIPEDNGK